MAQCSPYPPALFTCTRPMHTPLCTRPFAHAAMHTPYAHATRTVHTPCAHTKCALPPRTPSPHSLPTLPLPTPSAHTPSPPHALIHPPPVFAHPRLSGPTLGLQPQRELPVPGQQQWGIFPGQVHQHSGEDPAGRVRGPNCDPPPTHAPPCITPMLLHACLTCAVVWMALAAHLPTVAVCPSPCFCARDEVE